MAIKCPECQTNNPETASFCAGCGTNLALPKDIKVIETLETPKEELTTGSTFAGRYQIIEELGKGGMGKVYKVLDKEINTKVALKLMKPKELNLQIPMITAFNFVCVTINGGMSEEFNLLWL